MSETTKNLAAVQRRYRRLKQEGICITCGQNPAEKGILKCKTCNDRHLKLAKKGNAKRYLARKAAGICTICGQNPARVGVLTCEICNNRYLARYNKHCKEQYSKRRAAGLCEGSCGRLAMPGKVHCAECARGMSVKTRKKRAKRRAGGICTYCGMQEVEKGFKMCQGCRLRTNERNQIRTKKLRDEVFAAYGGCRCACCGEIRAEFLQMDHVDGGGAKHRRDDPTAIRIYHWLKKNNYPSGFRVLCSNCNWAYARYGYCPHQDEGDYQDGNAHQGASTKSSPVS